MKRFLPLALAALIISASQFGCASVGHEMDMAQVQQIQKGVTTRADIERLFGKPMSSTGSSDGTSMAMWLYSSASSNARNFIPIVNLVSTKIDTKSQTLNVQFDAKNLVTNYSFSEGGTPINAGLIK